MVKNKGRVRVKQKAQVRKKGEGDSIPKMKAQMPRTTGAVLKVKMKRKND